MIVRFAVLALLWLALSGADTAALWFGIPAALAASALSLHVYPPGRPILVPHRALLFSPSIFYRGLVAGFDVARRAMDPRLPVSPAWLRIQLSEARSDESRVLLGGVVSVLPGTLAAGPSGTSLDVHVLQAEGFDAAGLLAEEQQVMRLLAAVENATRD